MSGKVRKAKRKVRAHRQFTKTPEARDRLTFQVSRLIGRLQGELSRALDTALKTGKQLRGNAKRALGKACELHDAMQKLLPQIRFWLRTGRVARGKIINLHRPQVYTIVQDSGAGKDVEAAKNWDILRVDGCNLLVRPKKTRVELTNAKFTVEMQKDALGVAPEGYAYDRGGWSQENLAAQTKLKVKNISLAPRGQAKWAVFGGIRNLLVRERAMVEGCGGGASKSSRHTFTKSGARSVPAMKFCRMHSLVGFNPNKLVRGISKKEDWTMVG